LVLAIATAGCIVPHAAPVNAVGGSTAAPAKPLRQAAEAAHRRIGTALMSSQLGETRVRTLVAAQFDSLTPENEMKWDSIEPSPGNFSFAAGDRLVAFASENGIRMRGHTLVWHSQLAGWVKGLKGEALHAALVRHVQGVVGHYKG
jgi:endo-1,4-beta-xylanase